MKSERLKGKTKTKEWERIRFSTGSKQMEIRKWQWWLWLIENHTGLSAWWVEHLVVRARAGSEAWLVVLFWWLPCGWLRFLIGWGCRGCWLFFRRWLRGHWLRLHFLNYSRLLRHWCCKREKNGGKGNCLPTINTEVKQTGAWRTDD